MVELRKHQKDKVCTDIILKSMLHRFDANYRVATMMAKISNKVREILVIKKECILVLMAVKMDSHQDDVKQRINISPFRKDECRMR